MPLTITADPQPLAVDRDGVVRVGGTRVTLETLIAAFRDGASPETIADQYPSLHLADIYTAIGYYLRHVEDVDCYLEQARQHSMRVRQQNEAKFNPIGVRERLLARRNVAG